MNCQAWSTTTMQFLNEPSFRKLLESDLAIWILKNRKQAVSLGSHAGSTNQLFFLNHRGDDRHYLVHNLLERHYRFTCIRIQSSCTPQCFFCQWWVCVPAHPIETSAVVDFTKKLLWFSFRITYLLTYSRFFDCCNSSMDICWCIHTCWRYLCSVGFDLDVGTFTTSKEGFGSIPYCECWYSVVGSDWMGDGFFGIWSSAFLLSIC